MNTKIEFTDVHGLPLFYINDGENIIVERKDGTKETLQVKWAGPNMFEIDGKAWHMVDFARRLEDRGASFAPEKPAPLPPFCYGTLPSSGDLIKIARSERGYYPCPGSSTDRQENEERAACMNRKLEVTPQAAAAMLGGSLFGWDTPAAKPGSYDYYGKPVYKAGPTACNPDSVLGEKQIELTLRVKEEGYEVLVYDSESGSAECIECEDIAAFQQDASEGHMKLLKELQFWVDSIREEAHGGEKE